MITREQVIDRLKTVYDPEVPVDIWELGLIYEIQINDSAVHVKMTLTSPSCPSAQQIPANVKSCLAQIPEVSDVAVEVVWEPQWTAELISPEGKKILKIDT
ncbi:MAG: aromatic ring hydroxylase [Candidatus Omnitrophica bacterium CG11_big_fil_rev_8_21_14_0_20_45_26]|uniref:Aromatic ring hydroxylase n=1 Tax=Candidatus Abzuiibacterium crystallinum TaxID=1974748 RepID=A0A2H0LKP7_9BACT|nr:MAG: aromatic ring hydroxylase [Candidatus Omnitrophica bacterium CG11_big_fil_rev_8_21_14_0_20_45_26]PIW63925.1 MAG: aromatic ring hydroxylase [Candidatus Omnitrophica bacterium CG12_big_fil_rev_8_21_14_0_65_45_16]